MNSFIIMWARVFTGRINRMQYFKSMLFIGYIFGAFTLVYLLLVVRIEIPYTIIEMQKTLSGIGNLWALFPLYFLQAIFSVGLGVRRLKDMNINPMFILVSFLPYIGIPFFIMLVVKKGDNYSNQYGVTPQNKRDIIAVILNK